MKRSRGLHYTQVPCHFLSAGTLQPTIEYKSPQHGENKNVVDGLNNNLSRYSTTVDSYVTKTGHKYWSD